MKTAVNLCDLLVLGVLAGCCSVYHVPTAADHQAILSAVVQYKQSMRGQSLGPTIRVHGNRAWAKYLTSRGKIALYPIIVELEKKGSDWTVTAAKSNWPWWREVKNKTIGFK